MQTKRRKPQVRSATSQRADQTTRARDLADPQIPTETLPLAERLKIREEFFEQAGIDPRQFLRAFDAISSHLS